MSFCHENDDDTPIYGYVVKDNFNREVGCSRPFWQLYEPYGDGFATSIQDDEWGDFEYKKALDLYVQVG